MSNVATQPVATFPASANGGHSQPANTEDGLGYSRHYAQRIRELGKTSKESWIKRLWNHMFGNSNCEEHVEVHERAGGDASFSETASRDKLSVPKDTRKNSGERRNPVKSPPESAAPSSTKEVRFKDPGGVVKPHEDSAGGLPDDAHSATPSKSDSAHDKALEGLPAQLLNSPYLPPKDRLVLYRSLKTRETVSSRDVTAKPRYMNPLSKSMSTLGSSGTTSNTRSEAVPLNPHRQSHPYLNQLAREGTSFAPKPKVTRDATVIQLEKRAKALSDKALKKLIDVRPSTGQSSPPSGQSSPLAVQLNWSVVVSQDLEVTSEKPSRVVTPANPEELRVAELVQHAVESSKIFTCDAPYPVDAFVRISLRKRGWVEKFGPKVTNATTVNTSPVKLEVNTDEEYQMICDMAFPKPWEEDNGLYAIMSRFVHCYPVKFIWGGKSVNNLVLKSDVTVNHFPKAKYFSSKVLLATSLRDLAWHNNTDSLAFFPRCYLLNEDDKQDIIEDFHITACMALLKLALDLYNPLRENPLHPTENQAPSDPNNTQADEPSKDEVDTEVIVTPESTTCTDTCQRHEPDTKSRELGTDSQGSNPLTCDLATSELLQEGQPVDTHDVVEENATQCAADINDDVDNKVVTAKSSQVKVIPDLKTKSHERTGGTVPLKAVDWAIDQCDRYVSIKNHEDIDSRARRNLFPGQWNQLMSWFYQLSQDGATISMSENKLTECENALKRIKQVWPQYDLDGMRNIWIIKPGDKSKGIGISFCDNLDEIMQSMKNQGTQEYIIQKYIERPLLIYQCKFDIRQWFLVTDWSPLTVWFYKISYLRICSQEFSYDSMHESVHLSNVAVQENYFNGKRSEKLPENNFMTSEQFREYLSEVGGEGMWENKIYPGMKEAVINTLVATQEVTDHRKSAFELYGADFMMSEDYTPWLLEVNSSPGMLPSSIDKAKLCSSVIEDTIRVVLDHRENSGCDTGRFELIYHDTTNPNTRGLDSKLLLEGQRIKKPDLQRYMIIDQKAMKIQKDREEKAKERERRREQAEAENRAREERERQGEEGKEIAAVDSGCETSGTDASAYSPSCQSPIEEKSGEYTPEEKMQILASLQASTAAVPEAGNKQDLSKLSKDKQNSRFSLRNSIIDIYGGSSSNNARNKMSANSSTAKSKTLGKTGSTKDTK